MRVLLSTYGSRGDAEPMAGPAVQLGAFGAKVQVCSLPGFAELLASVGVPLVPIGQPVRPPVTGATTTPRRRTCPRARPSGSTSPTPSPRPPRDVMCRCCAA